MSYNLKAHSNQRINMSKDKKDQIQEFETVARKALDIVIKDFSFFDFFHCKVFDHEYYSAEKIKNNVSLSLEIFPSKSKFNVKVDIENDVKATPVCISFITTCWPGKKDFKLYGYVRNINSSIRDDNCFAVTPPKTFLSWFSEIINKNRRSVSIEKPPEMEISGEVITAESGMKLKYELPNKNKILKALDKYAGFCIRNSKTTKKKQK